MRAAPLCFNKKTQCSHTQKLNAQIKFHLLRFFEFHRIISTDGKGAGRPSGPWFLLPLNISTSKETHLAYKSLQGPPEVPKLLQRKSLSQMSRVDQGRMWGQFGIVRNFPHPLGNDLFFFLVTHAPSQPKKAGLRNITELTNHSHTACVSVSGTVVFYLKSTGPRGNAYREN